LWVAVAVVAVHLIMLVRVAVVVALCFKEHIM
jgi:hypothetical protein